MPFYVKLLSAARAIMHPSTDASGILNYFVIKSKAMIIS